LRLLFIGDIIGKPGRVMVKHHLAKIREKYSVDFVVANYENTSHGFGMTPKNYKEIKNAGIDVMTGGNHSFDKKEIFQLLENEPILRPLNMYEELPGRGIFVDEDKKLAIISLMGDFAMPRFENPFRIIEKYVDELHKKGYTIFVDFHAEATAEKRTMFLMLKNRISALVGTHTHIGTDDLLIDNGAGYLTDIGLTGCFDNVIGMSAVEPLQRCKTGFSKKYDVVDNCKKIFQAVIFDFEGQKCVDAFKLKAYDFEEEFISQKAFRL
jgi:metallophosphoesterase (TIGR00282 family)